MLSTSPKPVESTTMKRVVHTVSSAFVVVTVLGASCRAWADDPTLADCITANESSIALRRQHKLRAARAQLLVCSAASCPEEIRSECVRRVTDVNVAMPTIVFNAKDGSGNDLGD